MTNTKACSICNQDLDFSMFSKSTRNKSGLHSWCKACTKQYMREYNKKNEHELKPKRQAYKKQFKLNNPNYDHEYYIANKERLNQKNKQWREKNLEKKRAYDRQYSIENRDKTRLNLKRYAERNPEKISLRRQKRRAILKAASIYKVTSKEIAKLLQSKCAYCQQDANHIDHVIPLSRGGSHSVGNLLPSCMPCNLSKGSKFLSEWKLWKRHEELGHSETTQA